MFWFRSFIIAALPGMIGLATVPAQAADPDPLSTMFNWWNASMRDHVPFDSKGFARHFTSDAVLELDGVRVASGIEALTRHFRAIQDSGAQVEIVLPFAAEMIGPRCIYTNHVIRSRRSGTARCMLAAGHADLEGDRIKSISLVRSVIQPGSSQVAKACWINE